MSVPLLSFPLNAIAISIAQNPEEVRLSHWLTNLEKQTTSETTLSILKKIPKANVASSQISFMFRNPLRNAFQQLTIKDIENLCEGLFNRLSAPSAEDKPLSNEERREHKSCNTPIAILYAHLELAIDVKYLAKKDMGENYQILGLLLSSLKTKQLVNL